MLSILKFCIFLLPLLFSQLSYTNNYVQGDSVKYSIDFKFNDGLFLNFQQVLSNDPLPFKNIISEKNISSETFTSDLLNKNKIRVFLDGVKVEISTSSIWAYAKNGVLYIQHLKAFYRIPSIGSISFFVANIEVKYQSQIDPWSPNYYNSVNEYTTTELHKYLIDFKDGTLYDYSIQNIETLISSDTQLFNEFTALRKRKRKQMAFIYIRRYNENNPLYFFIP